MTTGTLHPSGPVLTDLTRSPRRDAAAMVTFLAIAFGLAWLVALPVWLGDGLESPLFPFVAIAMMLTPALAALVTAVAVEKRNGVAKALGLWPLRPVRRLIGFAALGIFVPIVLVLVALPIGAGLGVYPADFSGLSGFAETLRTRAAEAGVDAPPMSTRTIVLVQLLTLPLGAVIGLLPALGEELGWRGWLLPRLMRLGTAPAILVSGLVWGLWHAPVILLGYNYPGVPGWLGLAAMTGTCTVFGALCGWLRLRSASVWPAALAHAALNGSAASFLFFVEAGKEVETTQATVLGWSGWIVPVILMTVLILAGQFGPPASSQSALKERTAQAPEAESAGARQNGR